MESTNRMAIELVDEAIDFAEELAIGAFELDNGATVLDFGVDFDGGIEAGLLLAEIQTGGLATVQSRTGTVGDCPVPYVDVATDHPAIALLGCQKAGWEISTEDTEALGSGPARALVAREEEYQVIEYADAFDLTVLTLESDSLPTEAVAEHVGDLTDVNTESIFLPTFPTASLVGSVTLAARAPELALFRLFELGYDPTNVIAASGASPVAPVPADEQTAIARTNDALAYGGRAHLVVEEDFEDFDQVPSTAADRGAEPFAEILEDVDWDFYELDESVFAPAQVTIDVVGGPTHTVGEVREDLVAASFGFDGQGPL